MALPQEEAEAADADAAEAEKDMKVAVEKLRAAEESRELANEQLKDLESAVAAQGEAGHGVQEHNRAMKKRDERIEELTSQLQAQKATIDKLHQLVQVRPLPQAPALPGDRNILECTLVVVRSLPAADGVLALFSGWR